MALETDAGLEGRLGFPPKLQAGEALAKADCKQAERDAFERGRKSAAAGRSCTQAQAWATGEFLLCFAESQPDAAQALSYRLFRSLAFGRVGHGRRQGGMGDKLERRRQLHL
jgi:hypothetical protein